MGNNLMQADLSVWGMYHHADIVVKVVMIRAYSGLRRHLGYFLQQGCRASRQRRLKREQKLLGGVRSLNQASEVAAVFDARSLSSQLINEAQNRLELCGFGKITKALKNVPGFVLSVAWRRCPGRHMGRGNGFLATIGAISPFVGLFGTVWGYHERLHRYCPDANH